MIFYLFAIVPILAIFWSMFEFKDWILMIVFGLIIAILFIFWQDPGLLIGIRLTIIAIALAIIFTGSIKILREERKSKWIPFQTLVNPDGSLQSCFICGERIERENRHDFKCRSCGSYFKLKRRFFCKGFKIVID